MRCLDRLLLIAIKKTYNLDITSLIRRKQVYEDLEKYIGCRKWKCSAEQQNIGDNVIWQYWDDHKKMPAIVERCMESVANNALCKVIVLSDENVKEYIRLPDFIEKKYKSGIISKPHYSDILRVSLLSVYGGTWIDATVFCTGTIPREFLSSDIFVFQRGPWKMYDFENMIRCSNWFMTSKAGNKYVTEIRDSLYNYWKEENEVKDYHIFHVLMSRLLDDNHSFLKEWKKMPFADTQHPHYLQSVLNREYKKEEWEKIKSISNVHKLTYKYKKVGSRSIYQKIIDKEIR